MRKQDEFSWDIDPVADIYAAINVPIEKHECTNHCKQYPDVHDIYDIFDDFRLSQRQREKIYMEIIQSRGRLNRETVLWRRYQNTKNGSYVLRLQTATEMTLEVMGDLNFETEAESREYYNYGIQAFKFTEVEPVPDPDESAGFFAACDDLDESEFSWADDTDEFSW